MFFRSCALGLFCLFAPHFSEAMDWINPTNVNDPRFDSTTGQLKANPKNDTTLEIDTYRVPARRSTLLDRKGKILAYDVAFTRPAIWLIGGHSAEVLKTFENDLKKLNSLLNKDIEMAQLELDFFEKRRGTPIVLNIHLTEQEILKIQNAKIPRLRVIVSSMRSYPFASEMAHAVGWSTALTGYSKTHLYNPIYGQSGLESLLNKELTPRAGTLDVLRDTQDNTLKIIRESSGQEAKTVKVSIDSVLQKKLLISLKEKIKKGVLLVADALSGEVVVMLSLPSFDPNKFSPFEDIKYKNKILSDTSEPLSNRIFRKYQGIDLNAFKNSIRFKEDFEILVVDANANYAKLMSKETYSVEDMGVTPLYLLTLAQTLTYSAPLTLTSNAALKNIEDLEDLGVWNRVNFMGSATRDGSYVADNSAYTQTHKALVSVSTTEDRKYNIVLISEDTNMSDSRLSEINTTVEKKLGTSGPR